MTKESESVSKGKQHPVEQPKGRWGLRGKTGCDWLQLAVVPVILVFLGWYLQNQANQRQQRSEEQADQRQERAADDRAKQERLISDEQAKQETLNKYFDEMTNLLLERNLRATKLGDEAQNIALEARTIARARTLTALSVLC